MRTTAHLAPECGGLLWLGLLLACGDPVKPGRVDSDIVGYAISGQASGTDPATGEELTCAFIIDRLDTGGSFLGTWTDTTTIKVIRIRRAPTQQVTYDTTIAAQEVSLTVSDSFHIAMAVTGPLAESLTAGMIPAYPGYGSGDWTCGPGHPLSRVQPDAVLTGRWLTQPIINLPIG